MGGYGSGGGRSASKTDGFWRLDIAKLKELGMLQPGRSSQLVWSSNGERRASIGVEAHEFHLVLDYRARSRGDEWQPIRDIIPLDFTEPNYGGRRAWFVCPSCRHRKRVLYGATYYRCRTCYGATYQSQYERDYMRALDRAQAIRDKLGGSLCTDDPFPEKPKRMRWKTYYRLMAKERAFARASNIGAARALGVYWEPGVFD